MIRVKALNAKSAEILFRTELFHYKPVNEELHSIDLIRSKGPYFLPESLAAIVSLVDKVLRLPHLTTRDFLSEIATQPLLSTKEANDDPFNSCNTALCRDATTPAVISSQYKFPTASFEATPGNSMACAEFQFQGARASDLSNFAKTCGVAHVKVDKYSGWGGRAIPVIDFLDPKQQHMLPNRYPFSVGCRSITGCGVH